MASFSDACPYAFHVAPLHSLKGIWGEKALLAASDGINARPTTACVDRALGVSGMIHFYLASGAECVSDLPILKAQMGPSPTPPFPHVVFEVDTQAVDDNESVVCNWNLAVSRPKTASVRGGNWSRGTSAVRIAEVWKEFRETNPAPSRARGCFNDPYLVPTLCGPQIREHVRFIAERCRDGFPELLLRSPFLVTRCKKVHVFSEQDERSIKLLGDPLVPMVRSVCGDYSGGQITEAERGVLDGYLQGAKEVNPDRFNCDNIRRRL